MTTYLPGLFPIFPIRQQTPAQHKPHPPLPSPLNPTHSLAPALPVHPTGKWGFTSAVVGSTLRLRMDTSTPMGSNTTLLRGELAILKSYEHMGQVRLVGAKKRAKKS